MAELDSLSLPDSEDEEDLGKGSDVAETSFVAGIDTPLHEAVEEGKVDVVRGQLDALDEEDLRTQLSSKNSSGDTVLHLAAEGDTDEHVEILQVLLDKGGDPNCLDESEQTPLHLAASNGNITMVKMLVDAGADIDKLTDLKETALHQACVGGSLEVVQFLAERGAQVETADSLQMSPLHDACTGGHLQIVQILLEKGCAITGKDDFGDTPLDNAIEEGDKEIVAELLKGKGWREVLRSCNEDEKTTPFRRMVENMPELAEWVMTQCTETNAGRKHGESIYPDSVEFRVTYDYEFLEDFRDSEETDPELSEKERGYSSTWGPTGFKKSKHPLYMMAQKDSNKLLSHPLVTSLLDYKWNKFGRYLFFTNLLIYLVFLGFLTAFALWVPKPLDRECVVVFNSSWDGVEPGGCSGSSDAVGRFVYVSAAIIIVLAVLRLSVEIVQIIILHVYYFLDWVNWLELLLYIFSIIFVSVFRTSCLCVEGWKWQIGVLAVFLGWIILISFLQKWPLTGIYVLMLVNIFYSFLRIAFLAFLLVVAFGLAFYMLFYDPEAGRTSFSTGGRALVKTMTMTTGEFEYDSIFHQSGEPGEDDIEYPPASFLLWIIFLVVMPILLNNLLVGLAVGDVGAVQEAANAKRLRLQTELVLSFEELFPKRIRRYFITRHLKVYPNHPGRLDKFFALLQDDDSLETGEKIIRSLNPPTDSVADLKKELEDHLKQQTQELDRKMQLQNEKITAEMKTMKQGIAELTKHSKVLADLVKQLAEKQGVGGADPGV